jgi:hypothetical protein
MPTGIHEGLGPVTGGRARQSRAVSRSERETEMNAAISNNQLRSRPAKGESPKMRMRSAVAYVYAGVSIPMIPVASPAQSMRG